MLNKFSASCATCRQTVPAGAGETNKVGERWVTKHVGGCPPARTQPKAQRFVGLGFYEESGDECGWTACDWQEACNPNEGDK